MALGHRLVITGLSGELRLGWQEVLDEHTDQAKPDEHFSEHEAQRLTGLASEVDARPIWLAHKLVKELVVELHPDLAGTKLPLRYLNDGRPIICGGKYSVSLSHGAKAGAAAACASQLRIGVDIEDRSRADQVAELESFFCHDAEIAKLPSQRKHEWMLELWVAKESLIKAGAFSMDEMGLVDLSRFFTGTSDLTLSRYRQRGQLGRLKFWHFPIDPHDQIDIWYYDLADLGFELLRCQAASSFIALSWPKSDEVD